MPLSQEQKEAWSHIVELTQSMVDLVKQQQWEQLADLESQRRDYLQAFFQQPFDEAERRQIDGWVSDLMAIDHGIVEVLEKEKGAIAEQLKEVSHGVKVSKAYQNNRR